MTADTLELEPFFDWTGLDAFDYPLDQRGIPLAFFNRRIGMRHNPITIAQYGLAHLQKWRNGGGQSDRQAAERCGEWLIDHLEPWAEGQFAWIYRYDLDFYGPRAPWISAMAQGEGIALLLRLYQAGSSKLCLETAKRAVTPFFYSVDEKGVVDRLSGGDILFEEYPTLPASHVLNGFVFALFGLDNYARFFKDDAAHALCRRAIGTLERNWQLWNAGFWSRYDLHPTRRLASPMYHELHIRQMQRLALLSRNPLFQRVALLWKSMQHQRSCIVRMWAGKAVEKIRLLGRKR
ncbi:hypothetical protein JW992_06735 [candidate division KSB1 bacterium]|nr:hypothetical protein [candidate division KSB1 bacterium]